jgi:polysaccharide export outer membrane protein
MATLAILAMLASLASGCGASGSYVWVDEWREPSAAPRAAGEAALATGDVVTIRVYNQDALTTRARVRADGRVALPLVGPVQVAGQKPSDVAKDIEARLAKFVVAPSVTINVDESKPLTVSVVGEVARAGVYALEPPAGVVDALASAGGLGDYADRDRIFVLRREPVQQRIRFTYRLLTQGGGKAPVFRLHPGDVVVVE